MTNGITGLLNLARFSRMRHLQLCVGNATDSYKMTHWKIYPDGLSSMSSYLEARSASDFADETVFFGLQYFIKRFLIGEVITLRDLPRLKAFCKNHFYGVEGLFNEEGWRYIINHHKGRLPVSIRAVAEGTVVPVSNALMVIKRTDPKCAWLTNFLETLLVEVWNPITVASLSRAMKKTQYEFMNKTMDSDELLRILMPSRVHDFGYRGVSSPETAGLSGAAHLVNFVGTDTIAAIDLIDQFYRGNEFNDVLDEDLVNGEFDENASYERWDAYYKANMPGFSIPATEHSQMTLGGETGERDILENYIRKFPSGFIACVIDSFDTFNFINSVSGGDLKAEVLGRDGVLVHRPDSGDPPKMVVDVLNALGIRFGYRTNGKGYKVLNDKVRVIQGDGVNYHSHRKILEAVVAAGWSVENLAFGSGGALLQKVNRDTFSFAFKCSYAVVNNVPRAVFKKPKTDPRKNSKRGELALVIYNTNYITVPLEEANNYPSGDMLKEVYRNGELLIEYDFSDIRARAELPELMAAASAN